MKNCFRFFKNDACEFYPCHEGIEELNCLFCYCPLYGKEHCPGDFEYKSIRGHQVKVCSNCTFPHKAENYDHIIDILKNYKE